MGTSKGAPFSQVLTDIFGMLGSSILYAESELLILNLRGDLTCIVGIIWLLLDKVFWEFKMTIGLALIWKFAWRLLKKFCVYV